jgi:MtN3 and saliva related transmembrane protein
MIDALGWASSLVLLATIITQIRKQVQNRSAKGVSRWLYVGQTAASAGFAVYSALLNNWVFLFTNLALMLSALVGWALTLYFKRSPAS